MNLIKYIFNATYCDDIHRITMIKWVDSNFISKYNYAVVNDKVEIAVEKLEAIISAEKCRVDRIKDSILNSKEGMIHEQLYD